MVFSKALFLKGLAGVATVGTVALGWGFKEQIFGKKEVKEDDLGIPTSCTQTCELTKEQFEKIKFQEKESATVTFEGLDANDKVTLTVTDKTSDTANYPKGKSYKFKTASDQKTVTIKGAGDNDITITNTEVEFKETSAGGKLEKVTATQNQQSTTVGVNNLGIPNNCSTTSSCQLTAEQLKAIKFETQSGSTIEIEGLDGTNDKVTLTITNVDDPTNYPKGKKYSFKAKNDGVKIKGTKGGDISLTSNQGVDFKEKDGDVLEKVTVSQPQAPTTDNLGIPTACTTGAECELTSDQLKNLKFETQSDTSIEIEGLSGDNKVTLKIEDKAGDTTNYPKGKKYTLTSKSTSGNVTIKNVKDGNIVLEKDQEVVIRETSAGSKLEKAPEEIDILGIPKSCTTTSSCELTKGQFEKIKFEEKTSGTPTTIENLETSDKIVLTITNMSSDTKNYPKGKKYNFKTKTSGKTIKIKGAKNEDIEITESGIDFKETGTGGKLEKDNTSAS